MPKKIPLYLVLSLQFTIQVVAIVGLVGFLSYRSGQKAVNNLVDQLIGETSDRIQTEIDQYLEGAQAINQLHIAALESGIINLNNLQELHRYLILEHQKLPHITSLMLGTEKGDFRVIHRVDTQEIEKNLSLIKPMELPLEAGISEVNNPSNLRLFTVNKNWDIGRYLETIKNIDVRERPWYIEAIKTKKRGWSEPFQIGRSNLLAINGYAPFYDASSKIEGVFSVNISLNRLNEFLKTLSVSEKGQIFIIERNGLLIADSLNNSPFKYDLPESKNDTPGEVKFKRISIFDDQNYPINNLDNLKAIKSPEKLKIKFNNIPYYLQVIPYKNAYNLDWLMVILIPEAQFMETITINAQYTLALCILALIVALFSGFFTSRKITGSLSNLSKITSDFSKNHEFKTIPLSFIQEIASLSQSFQKMMITIKEAEILKENYTQQLEQEVKTKTQALLEAQKIASVGSWEFNLKQKKVIWSEPLYDIYEAIELINLNPPNQIINIIHPEEKEHYKNFIKKAITNGQNFNIDLKIITHKNNIRYIQAKGQPVFNEQGEIIKYIGTVTDITERKLLEISLHDSEIKFKDILDSLRGIITRLFVKKDHSWTIDYVSGGSENICGYPAETLQFDSNFWLNLIIPEDWQAIESELYRNIFAERQGTYEYRIHHKNGSIRWISQTNHSRWDEKSNCWVVTIISLDISDRKKIEEELVKAKELAESAVIAKSQFLANMSHEIRTPMNGVLGMLYLLEGTTLNPDQEMQVKLAKSSAESLLNLINDILDFSKVEAGKLELENIEFNLLEMLNNFAKTMALKAQEKGLEFILDLTELDVICLKGDPHRLQQILTNLVANAIKFTEVGHIIIKVTNKTFLEFSIKDTGIGIPEAKISTLFHSFTQVDSSMTRKYGGTGLGLAIVKKLCQLMGGDITVTSELNKGSEFIFNLPLETFTDQTYNYSIPNLKNRHILLIDDNINHLEILARQLQKWGANVTTINNFNNLHQITDLILEKPPFDYAFIDFDLHIPQYQGLILGQNLKTEPHFQKTTLILMHHFNNYSEQNELKKSGFLHCLNKPIITLDLITLFQSLTKDKPINLPLKNLPIQDTKEPSNSLNNLVGKHLLVVEDNRVNQLLITALLRKLGIIYDLANDGLEALNFVENSTDYPYDLILMDCQLPHLDGYEATRQIRQGLTGDSNRHLIIIALTANALQGDREKCLNAGMNDYMTKPINPVDFTNRLTQWLQ